MPGRRSVFLEEDAMRCLNCGLQVTGKLPFCRSCGAKIEGIIPGVAYNECPEMRPHHKEMAM